MKRALLVGVSLACGSPTPRATAVALPSATAHAAAPTVHAPSRSVVDRFTLHAPKLAVFIDVEGLEKTKLMTALAPQLLGFAARSLEGQPSAACVDDAFASAKEIVAGRSSGEWLFVMRYDDARLPSAQDCFGRIFAKEATRTLAAPGVLVVGTPTSVEQSLRGGGSVPSKLALGPSEYARLLFDDQPVSVDAGLAMSDERFAVRAEADVPEPLARNFESGFGAQVASLEKSPPPGISESDAKAVARVLGASKITRAGSHVTYALVLDEGLTDQARDLGMLSAFAAAGVRQYLNASKEAEATNAIHSISRNVIESWEREEITPVPRTKKRLRSFPPVPKAVPRGAAYQTTAADWSAWSPLKFEMDQPQRYQYEVKAAPDGMSADVIARGDLDGDGKTSLFVVHVTVDKTDRTLKLSPLETTDPDEISTQYRAVSTIAGQDAVREREVLDLERVRERRVEAGDADRRAPRGAGTPSR